MQNFKQTCPASRLAPWAVAVSLLFLRFRFYLTLNGCHCRKSCSHMQPTFSLHQAFWKLLFICITFSSTSTATSLSFSWDSSLHFLLLKLNLFWRVFVHLIHLCPYTSLVYLAQWCITDPGRLGQAGQCQVVTMIVGTSLTGWKMLRIINYKLTYKSDAMWWARQEIILTNKINVQVWTSLSLKYQCHTESMSSRA